MNLISTNKKNFCEINLRCEIRLKLITNEKEITPILIEEILHQTKSLEQVNVKEIKIDRTLSTFTSNIFFIRVNYSKESSKMAPKRLFLKISKIAAPESGKREVIFYNNIANHMKPIPLIPCYDAKYDEKTGRSHILLKDLTKTHFRTDYPIPPNNINCKRFIKGLAKIHAFWWDHELLEDFLLKLGKKMDYWTNSLEYQKKIKDQEELVQNFLRFLGDKISKQSQITLSNSIEFAINWVWNSYKEGKNLTLVHSDAHTSNALYPKDDVNGKLYFCDWQSFTIIKGTYDLAYFMGINWYPERRRRMEKALLIIYHETLVESGVTNYSWNECYNDYRSAIVVRLYYTVIWQWFTQKTRAHLWWSYLERALRAFEDLKCHELVI